MKKTIFTLALTLMAMGSLFAQNNLVEKCVKNAAEQVSLMVAQTDTFATMVSPRKIAADGKSTAFTTLYDWTSGFYPGSLWYLYELTGENKWKESAIKYTQGMEHIKNYTGNHDIGFMIFCSFGNGLRLTGNEHYKDVIITAARSLTTRYRQGAGLIQSWNKSRGWLCPVIIDNMMNLELMFEATKMSGDSTFWKIAVSHADKTMQNHYRPDMSCYHVVDYDPLSGAVRGRYTAQGYADESAWARGQAWGLYGYTLCYRYTRDPKYLAQAEKIAAYIFEHKNMPADLVPYWDFDAPANPADGKYPQVGTVEPRDASAAAIAASAMYELSTFSPKNAKKYKKLADKVVSSLASKEYTAPRGENGNFILMHSTGNAPGNGEIDTPLVYADYYFLEALKRKNDIEKN
ncbi:MAG: glycoside hydrolase family 88 protein [Mucinivorans sp.]